MSNYEERGAEGAKALRSDTREAPDRIVSPQRPSACLPFDEIHRLDVTDDRVMPGGI